MHSMAKGFSFKKDSFKNYVYSQKSIISLKYVQF